MKSSDDGTRLELVKKRFGLSFITLEEAQLAEKDNFVRIIPSLNFTAPLHFVIAKNRAQDPVIKALLQEVRILWHQQV